MNAYSTPNCQTPFVQLGVKKCGMRAPLTMCADKTTLASFEWQSALFGNVAPGAVSNKINYQGATQRPGRSSGFVSSHWLRCVDAAALINQLHKLVLTIVQHSARRASSLLSCPSCKMRRRHKGAAEQSLLRLCVGLRVIQLNNVGGCKQRSEQRACLVSALREFIRG